MKDLFDLSPILDQTTKLLQLGKTLLIVAVAVLVVCLIFKLIFGRNSIINRSLRASIGILFIYVCTVLIYTFDPAGLASLLPPLPFLGLNGVTAVLFSFENAAFPVICHEILSMILLAFVYHVIDAFMPTGVRLYWLLYRFLTVGMSLALHYFVSWLLNTFMPSVLVLYAPTVLLVVLFLGLFLGLLKVVLGLVLAVANPILGGIYAFFFSSKIGRDVSKAVVTALFLTVLVYILERLGYQSFGVDIAALITYIPTLLILLLVWYIASWI